MRTKRAHAIITMLAVLLLLCIMLFPVVWIAMTSLKTRSDIFAWPPVIRFSPTFSSYVKFLTPGSHAVLRQLTNSVVTALGTVVMTLAVTSLAAYSFSRFRFRGRVNLLFFMLGTRLLPPVTAVIPLFLSYQALGIVDTRPGLVLIYMALNIPFATWMLKAFFDSIPIELEESAQIDGCTRLQSLLRILIPLAAPGMVAVAIFVFRIAWNEFTFAFIFTSMRARTLPVRIAETIGEMQIYWADMAALAMILIVPALIFSYFMQRHLVRGLTTGALK